MRLLHSSKLLSRLAQLFLLFLLTLRNHRQLPLQQRHISSRTGTVARCRRLQLRQLRLELSHQRIRSFSLLSVGSGRDLGCCSCSRCAVGRRLHLAQTSVRNGSSFLRCGACGIQLLPQAGRISLRGGQLRSCRRQLLLLLRCGRLGCRGLSRPGCCRLLRRSSCIVALALQLYLGINQSTAHALLLCTSGLCLPAR